MNRFRRKTDARRRKEAAGIEVETAAPAPNVQQSRTPVLPQVNDFRTSLILPHLTRRFTLLRAEDGTLVSFLTMQSHLAAQRETGRLTNLEVEAVLAQYQLQSLSEQPHPPSRSAPAWSQDFRQRDWTSPAGDDTTGSRPTSSLSTSTFDLERDPPYTASSFGGASSSVPFPYTIEPPSPTLPTVTSTPTIANFRRGGNSMFGGRVQSVAQLKMSGSSASLRSAGSPKSRRSPSAPLDDDEEAGMLDSEDLTGSTETEEFDERTDALEVQETRGGEEGDGQLAQLSNRQLNRISRVLDDIEMELSKTYLRVAGDVPQEEDEQEELTGSTSSSGPLSPTTSSNPGHDTEPIDPFFHRLAPASTSPQLAKLALPGVSPPPPPASSTRSLPKSDSASTLLSPSPSSSSPSNQPHSPQPPSPAHSLVDSDHRDTSPTPIASISSGEDYSLARQTSSSSKSSAVLSNGSTGAKGIEQIDEASEVPEMPGAFSSSPVSTRSASVNDGAFDLGGSPARGSVVTQPGSKPEGSRKGYAASSSASTDPSTLFSPDANVSTSSLGSTGSSYHANALESDDENYQLDLPPTLEDSLDPSSSAAPVRRRSTTSSDDDFLRATSAMSRRPSDDLLKDLQPTTSVLGGSDIALEDLLAIQDTLVRSASRRAERKAGAVTPSSSTSEERSRSLIESTKVSVDDDEGAPGSSRPLSDMLASSAEGLAPDVGRSSSETTSSLQEPFYTPSIAQSDAFEYSGLASSSKASDQWDHETDATQDLELEHLDDPFARDTSRDLPPVTPSLGDPVELDSDLPLRVPRSMPLRNPASTQSVLIRDVRNQATMATMALKTQQPASSKPPGRTKSIRKIKHKISSPQFVSGPSGIPAVPIINPDLVPSLPSPSASHDREASRDGRPKKNGIGLRFKMLLKKQSRDRLPHLNGDEVTPFVDFDSVSPDPTPPFTPPSQSTSQFGTTPSDFPLTPNDYPESPDVPTRSPASTRTDFSRSSRPSLDLRSDGGSHTTNGSQNLSRVVSRLRRSRNSDVSPRPANEDYVSNSSPSQASVASTSSPPSTQAQQPAWQSTEQKDAAIGLGLALSSRAAISYDIGSMRRRREAEYGQVPQTAPLDVQRHGQSNSLQFQQTNATDFSQPPRSAPLPGGQASRHEAKASIDSMRKLWDAAEDLGLSPEKAQELVDLSYNRDPSSSASNSTISNPRSRPHEDQDARKRSSKTRSIPAHSRDASISSYAGRARANSASTHGSVADRVPTPPPGPSHLRKASQELHSAAGPVRELPEGLLAVGNGGDNESRRSMLSLSTGGSPSLRPPLSPGPGSVRSFRSSGYGGSIYDYYAEEHEDSASLVEGERTAGGDEPSREEQDDRLVWQVIDDLRKNRDSGISDSFESHRSSYDSNGVPSPGVDPSPNPFDFTLRHKGRNQVAVPSARYPSIYVRDEKRLVALADEGGVAHEEEGNFFVRVKEEEEELGRKVGEK